MNLSKHIEVSKRQWDYWREYLESSGYTLVDIPQTDGDLNVTVLENGKPSSDYAMARQKDNGRWVNYITIRIPQADRNK